MARLVFPVARRWARLRPLPALERGAERHLRAAGRAGHPQSGQVAPTRAQEGLVPQARAMALADHLPHLMAPAPFPARRAGGCRGRTSVRPEGHRQMVAAHWAQ